MENVYCICVTPRENGQGRLPIGPLRYDFARDAVLIGREMIGIEYQNREVLADHWNKGPHHFWIEVSTNLMVCVLNHCLICRADPSADSWMATIQWAEHLLILGSVHSRLKPFHG